ncbi:circadian clock protein KaiB [Thiorhodococcus mannitoliphagus]|uniref:Circadian clock protein KaiB n=1 Tax=Thiorhodococcus mannitoliphagus TaxID=329406 RepID=A0A6P1DPP4_9GAMM|nr:circadian clock KaiB family protein [Thiorhodococcus mannitoliphagus]NEX19978.1 circadian clock protein KaiB [Thiorhodococcus mannitoliphagus]
MSNYTLRLFITGHTPQAERAIANLKRICADELQGRYEMEVVDLMEDPEEGERQRIIATPTLIKQLPPPLRRIIGDLSDKERVLSGLDIFPILNDDGDAHE